MLPLLAGLVVLAVAQHVHASAAGSGKRVVGAVLAAAGLALVVYGRSAANYEFLWIAPAWTRTLVLPLNFVAFVLLAGAVVPSNLRRWTGRPELWAVVAWAVAHVLTQEDTAAVMMFGGFGTVAALGIASTGQAAAARAPNVPLARESLTIAVGGIAFFVAFFTHAMLFGVAPVPFGRAFV